MTPTVSQLRAFVAVAQAAHFTRAAEAIGVSQPALSKDIRRLEEAVGAVLFDRSARSSTLTAAGRTLLPYAQGVLGSLDEFTVAAAALQRGQLGHVRLAASPSMLDRLVPEVMARLDAAGHAIELEVLEVDTGNVSGALAAGTAEIGVGHFVTVVPGFADSVIGRDEVVAMLASDHDLAAGDVIDLRGLSELPLLLWSREQNPAYHDHLVQLCRERGLDPYLVTSPSRILGVRSFLVTSGRAFTLVPASVPIRPGLVARSLEPAGYLPITMLTRHGASPAAATVAGILRTAVREQSG